ncbi:MAG: hypothetical protein HLUCCA09_01070 [Rhodobacteraceae bacterium HLUCCA09]|nr:MAG: hypothetical protein HLUCCA09_01070 [Rhodobacteraceae bacterium HLUCCA09]
MRAAILAAFPYTLAVFAAGAALGTWRTLVLAPRLGEGPAILLEVPVMLAVSYGVALWVVRLVSVPARLAPRLAMGAAAFVVLQAAEVALSTLILGRSLAEHWAAIVSAERLAGLAAQAVFAAMPALLLIGSRRP